MDLTFDFDRTKYICFCSYKNSDLVKEHGIEIMDWFYKTTGLPNKKLDTISDAYIPDDFLYIVGYVDDSPHWEILAKVMVTEEEIDPRLTINGGKELDKSKLH